MDSVSHVKGTKDNPFCNFVLWQMVTASMPLVELKKLQKLQDVQFYYQTASVCLSISCCLVFTDAAESYHRNYDRLPDITFLSHN